MDGSHLQNFEYITAWIFNALLGISYCSGNVKRRIKKKIQQVLNLLQCQERYTYVVTRENDKRAEEKHPEADGGEELPNFCMSNLP